MTVDASTRWWRDAAAAHGVGVIDLTLRENGSRSKLFESGRKDIRVAMALTGMRSGTHASLLEIGCGMGRLTYALADHFGFVLGTDVSAALIDEARATGSRGNVAFEITDGLHVAPRDLREWDVVFSCEVFHHLQRATVDRYVSDAFRLLKPGGQFVFQVNVAPIRLVTRISCLARRMLHLCGVKMWHGSPTAPGFGRKYHSIPFLRQTLSQAGFRIRRMIAANPNQTWFVATKPPGVQQRPLEV